jgi:hypothetical protein
MAGCWTRKLSVFPPYLSNPSVASEGCEGVRDGFMEGSPPSLRWRADAFTSSRETVQLFRVTCVFSLVIRFNASKDQATL